MIWGFLLLSHEPIHLGKTTYFRNVHGHTHSNNLTGGRHANVSVDVTEYTPLALSEAIAKLQDVDMEHIAEEMEE